MKPSKTLASLTGRALAHAQRVHGQKNGWDGPNEQSCSDRMPDQIQTPLFSVARGVTRCGRGDPGGQEQTESQSALHTVNCQ